MVDKQAVRDRVQLTWPNQEEKDYLLALIDEDDNSLKESKGNEPVVEIPAPAPEENQENQN